MRLAAAIVLGFWLVLAALHIADGGFYSDDWGVQFDWATYGYSGAIDVQSDVLGSKPLLAVALPGAYELLGTNPAWHHLMAAALSFASAALFYIVLRELRFELRDAVPVALLALLFPWASAIKLWPTGSLNNLAIIFLFGGLLIALRGLRIEGPRGPLLHLLAVACYAASVLTYETTTAVAALLWPAYVWLRGWRPALPRAAMDVTAVGAAAVYSLSNTKKTVVDLSDQLAHVPVILREGAHLIAASLVPLDSPADLHIAVTAVVVATAVAVVLVAGRGRGADDEGRHWLAVAAVALAALALCWVVYVPQAFYTPTFEGLEDRVNVLAVYPAAVLVYAVLRAAGSLVSDRGDGIAIAGCVAVAVGYGVHDLRQERDWARAAELQEEVLSAVERASPPDRALVLTFGHPAEVAPRVPVFNQSYDLHPAAQLRTSSTIQTYPVFEGSRLRCSPKGVAVEFLATPLYRVINLTDRVTAKLQPYSNVVFVDVDEGRHAVIRSPEECERALDEFRPGPWLRDG